MSETGRPDVKEKEVTEKLAQHLKQMLGYEIWYRTNFVLKSFKFFPRQPDIDILLCRVNNGNRVPPITAAEVKYIRTARGGRVNPSYYSGLDEAVALLLLGFDHVLLIHVVDEKVLSKVYLGYAKLLSELIRTLGLPLGYRVYAFNSEKLLLHRVIRLGNDNSYELEGLWVIPRVNPFLGKNDDLGKAVVKNRKLLADKLGIGLNST
ncbi:hypothetical protein B9Q04_12110 [Candidatus Marsarchaeota G2 archaeon BE_D]|uniref:Uncharacterized protein n=1 Tax=Candidatus Marsarchaeota G2 archaeon BE_D TaxID=1978158 RepID=A0A2R6C8J1_9ARCH|nr:MAG: hypothetical protein B9Q04_12110 [Candidatus Marsarchaeota G2 archaeon BE_D]